jgi:hypothetical protein
MSVRYFWSARSEDRWRLPSPLLAFRVRGLE